MNKILFKIEAVKQGGELVETELSITCPDNIKDIDEAELYLEEKMGNIMNEYFYDTVLDFEPIKIEEAVTEDERLKLAEKKSQDRYEVPELYTPEYYNFLYEAWIVGCITSSDEILSVLVHFEEAKMHGDYFSNSLTTRRWRWSFQESLDGSVLGNTLSKEDWVRVREYITRKYDIRFWDNGYHDLDYLKKKSKNG